MSKLNFKGRIGISGGPKMGPNGELMQYKIGGVLIGLKEMEVVKSQGWEMIECDVTITPTKIYREIEDTMKSARLDQVAMVVSDLSYWKNPELPTKSDAEKIIDELMS